MKIRVQQRDGSIAEIWLGDRYRNLMIWECTSDKVNELVIREKQGDSHAVTHSFDEDGYLLPEQYKKEENALPGTIKGGRIYIPPYEVKQ